MKTLLILAFSITVIFLAMPSVTSAQEMTKQDYLEKSRKQKNAGFIMLGGGAALFGIGAIVTTTSAIDYTTTCLGLNCSQSAEDGFTAGGVMMLVGGLSVVGSIPLFIISGNNRNKAAQMSFKNEPLLIPKYSGDLPRSVPSITLKVRI